MYQKFRVEYCSVHFLRKFYANMVPSDEPKLLKNLVYHTKQSTMLHSVLQERLWY